MYSSFHLSEWGLNELKLTLACLLYVIALKKINKIDYSALTCIVSITNIILSCMYTLW